MLPMQATQPKFVYLLNRARHALMTKLNTQSDAEIGISATQLGALFVISSNDGCSVKHLRDVMAIDGSAVTGLIRRMQSAAVIEKHANPNDGRSSQLFITEHGRSIVKRGGAEMQRVHTEMTEGFSDDELKVVARFLESLTSKFS